MKGQWEAQAGGGRAKRARFGGNTGGGHGGGRGGGAGGGSGRGGDARELNTIIRKAVKAIVAEDRTAAEEAKEEHFGIEGLNLGSGREDSDADA